MCRMRVLPDGREHGIVLVSSSTAFSEVFLFELAVNLSRNGSSLRSSAYFREGFHELTAELKYSAGSPRLRSMTTLRKGRILYLLLVIKGLPLEVSTCSRCVRDGSLDILCFDGLQLGYKTKYKRPFKRHTVRTSAVPRASLHAHLVTDAALAKALGTVLKSSTTIPTGSSKTVTTINGIRGYVMAVTTLLGNVEVDDQVTSFAGQTQHGQSASSMGRRWCPSKDGGVRRELLVFLRLFFQCDSLARSLSVQIVATNTDLRRRVPPALMARIGAVLTAEPSLQELGGGVATESVADADARPGATRDDGGHMGVAPRESGAGRFSEVDGVTLPDDFSEHSDRVEESDDDLSSAEEFESDTDETRVALPPYRDKIAPLQHFAEKFNEPALADTGGAKGTKLKADMVFRLRPEIPTTAAATLKIVELVRALTVDPSSVWAPNNDWRAVLSIHEVLVDRGFTADKLEAVLDCEDVCNLRLLRGAVACLAPAFVIDQGLRVVFADVLHALKMTANSYEAFVDAACAEGASGADPAAHRGFGNQPPLPALPSFSKGTHGLRE